MRRLLMICVIALLTNGAVCAAPDLDGIYLVDGVNPDATTYKAVLELRQHGEVFELAWTFEPSGTHGSGHAQLEGSVLAVIFQVDNGVGLATYTMDETGPALRLVGRWTMPIGHGVGTETLTKTKARTVDEAKKRQGV